MRIIPSEIKIEYGNGQSVTLGNDANWSHVRDYIDRLFQWDKSYPGDPVVPQEQAATERIAPIITANTALDPDLRIIDRIIIALGKSGGSLNNKATYQKMVEDGYVNRAIKPENNVHSKVRKYPSLIELSRGVFTLLPAGWELFRQLEQNGFQPLPGDTARESATISGKQTLSIPVQTPHEVVTDHYSKPEITGTDYLLKALYSLGGSARLDDLIDPMIEYGWRPNSDTREKKKHNVSALVFTSKEYVNRERGRATINNKGLQRLAGSGLMLISEKAPSPASQQNDTSLEPQVSHPGLFVQD